MNEVVITVRGESESRVAPERATVRLAVRAEGPERTEVVGRALALAAPVRGGLEERSPDEGLAEWSSTRVSVRSERPWNPEGARLAPVFTASVDFTAVFSDVEALSTWLTGIADAEGVEIGGTRWSLTPQTRARVEREVATAAVQVAVVRATAYAEALGLGAVTPLEIADTGLLVREGAAAAGAMPMARMAMAAAPPAGDGVVLEPEDITVAATVEARFRAS